MCVNANEGNGGLSVFFVSEFNITAFCARLQIFEFYLVIPAVVVVVVVVVDVDNLTQIQFFLFYVFCSKTATNSFCALDSIPNRNLSFQTNKKIIRFFLVVCSISVSKFQQFLLVSFFHIR